MFITTKLKVNAKERIVWGDVSHPIFLCSEDNSLEVNVSFLILNKIFIAFFQFFLYILFEMKFFLEFGDGYA